jgi:hypothetical protein
MALNLEGSCSSAELRGRSSFVVSRSRLANVRLRDPGPVIFAAWTPACVTSAKRDRQPRGGMRSTNPYVRPMRLDLSY